MDILQTEKTGKVLVVVMIAAGVVLSLFSYLLVGKVPLPF